MTTDYKVGDTVKVNGRHYRVVKVGATVDGRHDLILLGALSGNSKEGALLALTPAELAETQSTPAVNRRQVTVTKGPSTEVDVDDETGEVKYRRRRTPGQVLSRRRQWGSGQRTPAIVAQPSQPQAIAGGESPPSVHHLGPQLPPQQSDNHSGRRTLALVLTTVVLTGAVMWSWGVADKSPLVVLVVLALTVRLLGWVMK
jgi:hypothetical protein